MLGQLKSIKTEMNDDTAFDTEFKDKQDALIAKQTAAALYYTNISQN